jgi:hypothetical protein
VVYSFVTLLVTCALHAFSILSFRYLMNDQIINSEHMEEDLTNHMEEDHYEHNL